MSHGDQPVGRRRAPLLAAAPQIDRSFRIQAAGGPDPRGESDVCCPAAIARRQVLEEELPALIRQKRRSGPALSPPLRCWLLNGRSPPAHCRRPDSPAAQAIGNCTDSMDAVSDRDARTDSSSARRSSDREVFDVGRAADPQPAPQPLHVRMGCRQPHSGRHSPRKWSRSCLSCSAWPAAPQNTTPVSLVAWSRNVQCRRPFRSARRAPEGTKRS